MPPDIQIVGNNRHGFSPHCLDSSLTASVFSKWDVSFPLENRDPVSAYSRKSQSLLGPASRRWCSLVVDPGET